MKRNLITNVTFKNKSIKIEVLEKLSNNSVIIYSDSSSISLAHEFLSESIKIINAKIGGIINNVNVVIDPKNGIECETDLRKKVMQIFGNTVSKKDIDNILNISKSEYSKEGKEIILMQPLQFDLVTNNMKKSYSVAPIGRNGDIISATFAITWVKRHIIDFIKSVMASQSLKINQILTTYQTLSQIKLSEAAINSGSILLHFGNKKAFITINKNGGTLSTFEIPKYGFNSLIKGISTKLNCTLDEAKTMFYIYGSISMSNKKRVIHTKQEGTVLKTYCENDLVKVIKLYLSRIYSLFGNYIMKKNVQSLPIVISGKIENIDGLKDFSNKYFSNSVSIYNPMTYVETNYRNENILGIKLISERLQNVLGHKLDVIIQTNPNTISSIEKLSNKKKNFIAQLFKNIGGKKDEWHNKQ